MRLLLISCCYFFLWSASKAQTPSISFQSLDKKLNSTGTPAYYYENQLFTGETIDSALKEQKIIRYEIKNGLIKKQRGWDFEGNLVRSFDYKNGLLHGKILLYYSNGQKYLEENYKLGIMDGMQYGWYSDGSRRFISEVFGGIEINRYEYPKPESENWKATPKVIEK